MDRRIPPSARIEADVEALLLAGTDQPDRLSELGRLGAQLILQRAVEEEATAFLGRARYERTPDAAGSLNGSRPHRVQTAKGDRHRRAPAPRQPHPLRQCGQPRCARHRPHPATDRPPRLPAAPGVKAALDEPAGALPQRGPAAPPRGRQPLERARRRRTPTRSRTSSPSGSGPPTAASAPSVCYPSARRRAMRARPVTCAGRWFVPKPPGDTSGGHIVPGCQSRASTSSPTGDRRAASTSSAPCSRSRGSASCASRSMRAGPRPWPCSPSAWRSSSVRPRSGSPTAWAASQAASWPTSSCRPRVCPLRGPPRFPARRLRGCGPQIEGSRREPRRLRQAGPGRARRQLAGPAGREP